MILVVQGTEIQAQQRQAPGAGYGLRGEALATTLHAEEQNPLGDIQPGFVQGAREHRLAKPQPLFQTRQPADVCEARGIVFIEKHAILAEQLELGLHDRGQILLGDGAVVLDGAAGQVLGIARRQPAEIVDEPVQELLSGGYVAPAVAARPGACFLQHDGLELVPIGDAQWQARATSRQLRRDRNSMGHQNHRVPEQQPVLRDVPEQAHVHRVLQIGVKIRQQIDGRFPGRLDFQQQIRRFLKLGLRIEAAIEAP